MRINKLNGSFLSLVVFAATVGFISVALFVKSLPLFVAKAVYYCQQYLSSHTSLQIPHSFSGTIVFLLGIVLLLGIISFLLQIYKTQILLHKLLRKRIAQTSKLTKVAARINLDNKINLIEDKNLFSFCYGLFFPRILITTSLVAVLSDKELEAVLLHEKAHLRSFDPMKVLLGRAVSCMFFFLPIFSELNNNMNATTEILADRYVSEFQQEAANLKNALKKILSTPQVRFATVPAISNPDYLEIRIKRLVHPTVKHGVGISLSWRSVLTSLLFVVISLFLLQTPVSAFSAENSKDPSYFVCASDNACRQDCSENAKNPVSTPERLFTPQSSQYKFPASYK